MRATPGQAFAFGDFVLVPRERLLLRAGEPVALTAKAFDLLVVLVGRAGELVTKDELFAAVWPGVFVQETSLTVNISAVRKALEDGRNGNRMIQTVSGRGYRFVAPVTVTTSGPQPGPRAMPARPRFGVPALTSIVLAIVAGVVAGAVALWIPQPANRDVAIEQQQRRLAQSPTGSAEAYRVYLQGRFEWGQRSEAGLKRAIELFREAVAIDPKFAPAHSGLADAYATLGYLSYLAPAEAFPEARRHALRALELDPSLAEAHASLGFVKLYFDWDWPGAEAAFQHAITLDPNQPAPHQWHSIYLLAAGRPGEALRAIETAQQRDPLSLAVNTDLGFHYYYTGRYDDAVKQLKFVLDMNPNFPPAHLWLGRTYQELDRFDDALTAFAQVEERIRNWPVAIAARGFVDGVSGRAEQTREALAELQALSARRFVTSYGIALIHASLGDNDAAFAALEKAFEERSNWLVWLRLDPRWNALRRDARFDVLVNRMRFPGQ